MRSHNIIWTYLDCIDKYKTNDNDDDDFAAAVAAYEVVYNNNKYL